MGSGFRIPGLMGPPESMLFLAALKIERAARRFDLDEAHTAPQPHTTLRMWRADVRVSERTSVDVKCVLATTYKSTTILH